MLLFFLVGAVGWLIERLVIRRLYRRPLDTILATWGVGVILQQAVRLSAGAELRYVKMPDVLSQRRPHLASRYPPTACSFSSLTIVLLVVTYLLIFRTEFGMRLRAVTQNRRSRAASASMPGAIYALTFAYGAGLAGVAGALVSPLKSVVA